MENEISIRAATIKDLDGIYGFICHLEEVHFERSDFEDRFEANLQDPFCIYLVSVNPSGELTGFISCQGKILLHQSKRAFTIDEFYVARPVRGKGIGKALLAALEEKVLAFDGDSVAVPLHSARADLRKLFAKRGFDQAKPVFLKKLTH